MLQEQFDRIERFKGKDEYFYQSEKKKLGNQAKEIKEAYDRENELKR